MTIGTLLAFTLYLANFFDPVQQLSQLYNTFLSATAALDRITAVLDEEPDIVDEPDARELPRIDGHVHFEHVRFGYGELPDVLHDFDLDVPAGTTVALVGHTGAGKSTIAKLLARFYDPRDGSSLDRRHRPARGHAGVAPPAARDRAAGGLPLRRLDRGEHRLRPAERHARRDRGGRGRPSAPTGSSRISRTATTRRSASAASSSRSASASSSLSRERSSPTRGSSSSTRRPRRSTSAPSGASTAGCAGSSPAGRRSSSPTGCRRSAAPT